jgi:hypothetical protein
MQATGNRDGTGEHTHGVNREDHNLREMTGASILSPELPEALSAGILAMVKATTGGLTLVAWHEA